MPSENPRKSVQASRVAIKLKPCGKPLEKIIKLLGKLPLDTPLIDLDQHEALRKLRSEKLSASVANIFKTKTQPYPSEMARSTWRRNTGTDFPISQNNWPAAERERIAEAKKVQEEEEADYQKAYKRAQIETLSRYISSLDHEFVNYILGENRSTVMSIHEIDSAVLRYNWYRFHHDFMSALVDAVQRREKGKTFHLASALPSGAYIGPKGRFRPKLAPIVEALNGVEVDRIIDRSIRSLHTQTSRNLASAIRLVPRMRCVVSQAWVQ
jgi:hypothetical protein